jgi:hypothetical protein
VTRSGFAFLRPAQAAGLGNGAWPQVLEVLVFALPLLAGLSAGAAAISASFASVAFSGVPRLAAQRPKGTRQSGRAFSIKFGNFSFTSQKTNGATLAKVGHGLTLSVKGQGMQLEYANGCYTYTMNGTPHGTSAPKVATGSWRR